MQVSITFASATGNATGDRWRVEVEPRRYIVGIGKHGSFADRIETTKRNLIGAINRAFNDNKLAIRAQDGSSDISGGGGFFNQNIEPRSVELLHDGSYPVVRPVTIDAGSVSGTTLVYQEDLALIDANGTSGTLQADLSKWLHPGASLIKTRLVSISADTNDTTYSNPHYFEVRNNSRPYVDIIAPDGRTAVLRFKESFTGGGLDVSQIEIVDPGLGYKQEEINFNILTANGYGGELNATLDDNGSISNLSLINSGTNYALGDVILVTPPTRYRVGEEMTIRAKSK